MKPEPSMRMTCGAFCPGDAKSVARRRSGAGVQDVEARAIGAADLLIGDAQVNAGVAERAVAAVAGDGAVVDMDDLGLGVGAVGHWVVLFGRSRLGVGALP